MAGGIDNSSVLVGSKVICICVQVQVKLATSVPLFTLPPSCILRSPTGDKPWYLCQGKTCRYTISHPALGVTNERCSRAVPRRLCPRERRRPRRTWPNRHGVVRGGH